MLTVLFNVLIALACGFSLSFFAGWAWYWSLLSGIGVLLLGQVSVGLLFRKKMMSVNLAVQEIMRQGQLKMQAKIARWQTKPTGGIKQAQQELEQDQAAVITQARQELAKLTALRPWVPLLGKQLATMELQFAWQQKDFQAVDKLLKEARLAEPMLRCIKLARMYMKKATLEELKKEFTTAVRTMRYDQSALLYGCYTWMLVKADQLDEAMKVMVEANEKNEHAVLKQNKNALANNKVNLFTNAGFGDEWYALYLEEPKVRAQRQRANNRFF